MPRSRSVAAPSFALFETGRVPEVSAAPAVPSKMGLEKARPMDPPDKGSNTAPHKGSAMPYITTEKELAPLTALPPHRILIVNDDKPNAEELAEQLRKVRHVVEIAPDELRAVEVESTFKPDIAIIDLGLQGTDACALARSLRARANRDVRLVADGGTEEDHDRASQAGCFDDHVSRIHGRPFLVRRRKWLAWHDSAEGCVVRRLWPANRPDEHFVICMFAAAVCPASPPELAPFIPDEFLRRIRALAESRGDLADYLAGYKEKVFAEGEYWEDVLKGASLWFRFFNP